MMVSIRDKSDSCVSSRSKKMFAKSNAVAVQWVINMVFKIPLSESALRGLEPWFLYCSPLITAERQNPTKHPRALPAVPTAAVAWGKEGQDRDREEEEEVTPGKRTQGSSLRALLMQFSFSLAPRVQILLGRLRTNWHRPTRTVWAPYRTEEFL